MTPVSTGQIYAETDGTAALWEVVQVIAPPSGLTHVRLRAREGPLRHMVLSCRALPGRFRLCSLRVPRAPARPASPSPVPPPQLLLRDAQARGAA